MIKLSTLNSKMQLLAVGTNAKTLKGDDDESLTAIMYLAPNTISGYDVCPSASPGCIASCLFTAGRGAMSNVVQARTRKTKLFFEDRLTFFKTLVSDLNLFTTYCKDNNVQGYVRLNGTSDIKWEDFGIIDKFSTLNFYDYTKIPGRDISKLNNYHLTYSRDERTTDIEIQQSLDNNINVSVVFSEIPVKWKGHKVISGDLSDMRWGDEKGVIIGLKSKGLAKSDASGFVVVI
jgi:hypothetical protein